MAQVAQQATGGQLEQYRQAKLAEFMQEFPETMTEQGLAQLAKENPYRFAEATKSWERANNDYLAARYQVEVQQSAAAQQQQAVFQQYAQAEDQAFFDAHPEFHGEAGKKALAKVAEAAVAEMSEKFGYSREEITRQYNTDPTMRNRAAQEAAIALGRDRLNRQALKEKRYVRPLPPVQRPGSADMVPKVSEQRLAQLNRDLSEKKSVRAAAKLLAERRRGR